MSELAALAVVCGLTLGVGLWSVVSVMPRLSRPGLAHRVAPYLVDVSQGARAFVERRQSSPLPVLGSLLEPIVGRFRMLALPLLGNPSAVRMRLRQSGSTLSVDEFRGRQLVLALGGLIAGTLLAIALSFMNPVPAVVSIALIVVSSVSVVVAGDHLLQRSARARLARMTSELPIVLEFMTLSLSAGEGILDSFRRIARISGGELATELSGLVSSVNAGAPLSDSLNHLAGELHLPAFSRCTEQMVGALERGTPLADVLRAQAQDAREQTKRDLIEIAGRKEVAMMIPLVFLILPVTILFAIFPGIFVLQLGF